LLLFKLDKYVDFAALAACIDQLAPSPLREHGDPPFSTKLMVRVLALQGLYELSDEAVEYQLLDRMSFFGARNTVKGITATS